MELRIGRRGLLATTLAAAVAGFVPAAIAGPMHNVAAHADGANNGKHVGNGKGTTTAPDPCTLLEGPGSYTDTPPTEQTGLVSPFLTFSSDLGTFGDASNPHAPLCPGYNYAITAASQDGSSLGWLTSSSSSGTSVTPANNPTSTTETFALTPTSSGQFLTIVGSTNGYIGATASACSGATSLHITVTVTSPDGTKTVYDHLGPNGDSNMCVSVNSAGGTSYYG